MEMSRPRESAPSAQPKNVEQLFTQLKGTMGRNHRLDAIDELAVAKSFLHYADVGVRARAIREAHGDISILPLDQHIDGHDLREVAPVLKGMLISESERGKLEAVRNKIRNRFTSDMNKLGLTPSNWSRESDSWIYQGVAERRFYYRDSKKALDQKAPSAEADPLEEGPESAHELELVGDTRLGWEARAQSWKLVDRGHELKYQFDSRPVLDKLNKSDSSYPEIEGLLRRSYKVFDVAATDITRNTLQLIKKNFSKAELQRLGELIRKNLDFDGERAKEEADQKNKKEKNKEEILEKKNPWEGAKFYQKGDQIIYRRPTGEWSTGEILDDPEELSRNRKKFKVKNTEIDPSTGVSDGRVEEYTTDTPPRFYEPIPDGGFVYVGGKEYTRARHMGDNRVEFDLEEVGGDGKILNVDSEVVRAAMEAHRLAEAIDKHVENLRARIEKGVAARSKEVREKLTTLSKHAKEIEKIFGSASKINKLLPERVEEVHQRIVQIQKEFLDNTSGLGRDIDSIQNQAQETNKVINQKLSADSFGQELNKRLQSLDALEKARGIDVKVKEWKEKVEKYDAWVKAGKKDPKVDEPGPSPLPSENPENVIRLYAQLLNESAVDNLIRKEIERLVTEQFGTTLRDELMDQPDKDLLKERDRAVAQSLEAVQGVRERIRQLRATEHEIPLIAAQVEDVAEMLKHWQVVQAENKKRIEDLRAQKEALEKKLAQPTIDANAPKKEANTAGKEIKSKNKKLTELEDNGQGESKAAKKLREEIAELEKSVAAATSEAKVLSSAKRGDAEEPEKILRELDQQIAKLEGELVEAPENIRVLQDRYNQLDAQRDGLIQKLVKDYGVDEKNIATKLQVLEAEEKIGNKTVDAAKAAQKQVRDLVSKKVSDREELLRGRMTQDLVEKWKKNKIEVPRIDIKEQQQEVRTKVDDLDKKIAGLPVSDRVKRDLRSRLTALAEKIENLPRDQHAAEQALAEMWANEIRTLEVDIYAQDLHAKPEAKERYEKSEGRVELSSALIADLLRGRERALGPVINAIFDTTLTAEDYTPEGSGETFRRVKLDKKSADRMGEIFDGAKPPDSATLSRCGIRNWDEFRRDWKEIYAPQVVMHLQESARVMIDLRLQRDGIEEPEQKEEKKSLLRKGGKFNPINWFGKKPDPEEFKHALEDYNNKRAEVLRELKNIPLTKLADQLGMWIGGAMASINTEFRIHNAQSQAERAGILALTGLPEEVRLNLRQQGSYLMSPGEGGEAYRLWRTYDAEDMIIVKDLEASEYTRAEQGVQAIIAAGREYLGVLHASRTRPQSDWASYDSRLSTTQEALARLEPVVENLKKILNHDPSLDRSLVAMGNSHQMLRDQIASILNEARQYIPVEAAVLSMEEKEVLGVKSKMEKMVAKIDQGTSDAAAHDTTGVAENVRADMAADSGHEDGHDDHGGGQKKGKSVIKGKLNWLTAGVFFTATVAGILSAQVVEKINKPAQQERKNSSQKSEYQYGNLDAYRNAYNVDYKMVRADENSLEVRQANFENNIGPSNPIASIIEFDTQEKISAQDPEAAKGIVEAVKSIVKDPNWSATDQVKVKTERKLVSSVGEGYRNFGFMFGQSKYDSQTKPVLEAAKQKNSKEVLRLLQGLSKEKVEPNIDPSTVDKETGLPAYVKFKVERDAKGRVKSEETTKNLVNEMNKLKEGAENYYKAHPVTPDQMNTWIDEALNMYVLDESAKTKQEMKALVLGVLYSESTFHPSKVSEVNGGGYGIGQTAGSVLLDYPFGAADLRPNAFIAKNGVKLAVYELAKRLNKYPDMKFTMLAYVWGQNRKSLEDGDVSRLNIDTTKTKYSDLSKEQQDYVDIRRYANRNLAYRDFYRTHSFPETPPKPPTEILDQFIGVKGKPAEEKPKEDKSQDSSKSNNPPLVASR